MAFSHLLATKHSSLDLAASQLDPPRRGPAGLIHLSCMDTDTGATESMEPVLTMAELADYLSVSAQTLYDLRSKGRGPRGFRIGRQLHFRRSEIEAWLARMEASDGGRHAREVVR